MTKSKSIHGDVIESKTLKSGYWDIRPIISTNSSINLIIGQRSNGKSYGIERYFLQEYKKTKKRFCIVRRWHDDLKASLAQKIFDPLTDEIEKIFGKGYSIYYYRSCFYLVDDKGKRVDTIGYTIDLSTSHHTKSVPYTNVLYMLFDEFIPMSTEERVLPDELKKWDNVISTVFRNREAKIFLVSNTTSKFSPYFTLYGFDINKVEQGTITTKEFPVEDDVLRISLEYCSYSEIIGKKASKYTSSNMIKTGEWEVLDCSNIPQAPNETVHEKLLFTMLEPDTNIIIGCYIRNSKWSTLETDPNTLLKYAKVHRRQFLVLHQTEKRSKYHHLTNEKSLDYSTFNDLEFMLKDILETCDVDVEKEMYYGRIFADNPFTGDFFIHCWTLYGMVEPRALL